MSTVFNIIKALVVAVCEMLPLSPNGANTLLGYFRTVYTGTDAGVWFSFFAGVGVLAALIMVLKNEIINLFRICIGILKRIIKKENNETTEDESELILLLCVFAPVILWVVLKYVFSFINGNGLVTAIAFGVSGCFLVAADKIKRRDIPVNQIKLTDGVLSGVFRLMGFIPGMTGTGGLIFAGLLSGFSEKIIYKFSLLVTMPVIFIKIILAIPSALKTTLGIFDVIGCVVVLGASFAAAYYGAELLYNAIKNKKMKIFGYILFASAFVSLLLWMRG